MARKDQALTADVYGEQYSTRDTAKVSKARKQLSARSIKKFFSDHWGSVQQLRRCSGCTGLFESEE